MVYDFSDGFDNDDDLAEKLPSGKTRKTETEVPRGKNRDPSPPRPLQLLRRVGRLPGRL